MARRKGRPGRLNAHVLTHIKPDERRGVEAAAEASELTLSQWVRQLIVAELSRLQVREQLTQA